MKNKQTKKQATKRKHITKEQQKENAHRMATEIIEQYGNVFKKLAHE